jgi:CRISPR-associated protein Csb1
MSDLQQYDRYLDEGGPAALVIRQHLMPVEGNDGVVFPATFAAGDGFPGGYNIDGQADGTNVCLIDSVGSQANRIEPIFAQRNYSHLVPQIVVEAGERQINLLSAPHRAGDAIVRCSSLKETLRDAFTAVLDGNAEALAKVAPTSLVFGVWDSRDTQAKLPRLLSSTIRAFDVRSLTRSAQYIPATEYVSEGLLDEPEDKATKDGYAVRGFAHVPSTGKPGGVIATGGIRRDVTLALAALRLLCCGQDEARTLALRRYILGLALVAFTHTPSEYLRQGCLLVLDPNKSKEQGFVEVYPNGERKPALIEHDDATAYAGVAARAFGVGEAMTARFDRAQAKADVAGDGKGKKARRATAKGNS